MPAKTNNTTTQQFNGVNPREIDFVTRFNARFQALMELLAVPKNTGFSKKRKCPIQT